ERRRGADRRRRAGGARRRGRRRRRRRRDRRADRPARRRGPAPASRGAAGARRDSAVGEDRPSRARAPDHGHSDAPCRHRRACARDAGRLAPTLGESIMRDHRLTTALLGAAAALLLAGAPAGAQPVRPEPAPDSAPNNPNAAPPEKVAPPLRTPEAGQNSGSSGVIVPPAGVDPGITAPPP